VLGLVRNKWFLASSNNHRLVHGGFDGQKAMKLMHSFGMPC
jgi:hypothetical protein